VLDVNGDGAAPLANAGAAAKEQVEKVVDALDDLVPEADTVGNEVLADTSRTTRWAGLLFAICALALAPWIIVIALTLPARELSPNYDVAWVGFDIMLFSALASTALGAFRRSRYLAMAASWSAALLVTDAWFDTVTSPSGRDRIIAIAMALFVELPLAGTCFWLSRHAQDIADRRLVLLLRKLR
jgi:hypothetical protein